MCEAKITRRKARKIVQKEKGYGVPLKVGTTMGLLSGARLVRTKDGAYLLQADEGGQNKIDVYTGPIYRKSDLSQLQILNERDAK